MEVIETAIADVKLIKPGVFKDERGCLVEIWNEKVYSAAGIDERFVLDVHSRSIKYTLRGLHYQSPKPQGKLVGVVRGRVFDVAVDLRQKSPTFRRWVGNWLSGADASRLWIPPGFAHGFLVLSDEADFVYKCTDFHDPDCGRYLRWNDPDIAVEWPLPPGVEPILSSKDRAAPGFRQAVLY